MRQIFFDTETTGLEVELGHRIIEIGCIEVIDRNFTGNSFHSYINPGRKVGADTTEITKITDELLKDKPRFAEIFDDFLNFINDAELIAHNASFDVGFINHEFKLLKKEIKTLENYVTIFDTLALARKMFPGQRNSLDALCKRYKIDLTTRKTEGHGALLDARLLAEVYLLMTGGQGSLFDNSEFTTTTDIHAKAPTRVVNTKLKLPVIYATSEETAAHDNFLEKIKKTTRK